MKWGIIRTEKALWRACLPLSFAGRVRPENSKMVYKSLHHIFFPTYCHPPFSQSAQVIRGFRWRQIPEKAG